MRAGLMRERLAFQTKTESISTAGIVSATWATAFTVWGRVKQEDGRSDETEIGDRPMSQSRLTFITRYDSRITTALRISWRSRIFEIEGVLNRDERRKSMDILAIERVAA